MYIYIFGDWTWHNPHTNSLLLDLRNGSNRFRLFARDFRRFRFFFRDLHAFPNWSRKDRGDSFFLEKVFFW